MYKCMLLIVCFMIESRYLTSYPDEVVTGFEYPPRKLLQQYAEVGTVAHFDFTDTEIQQRYNSE